MTEIKIGDRVKVGVQCGEVKAIYFDRHNLSHADNLSHAGVIFDGDPHPALIHHTQCAAVEARKLDKEAKP